MNKKGASKRSGKSGGAPKVSVITITYNHEKYIREALDSFVAQQTGFAFEVIVADDCSSDNTQSIIREYAKTYPHIFKPILRKKNIGALPNFMDALRSARGTYVALCEGDDFWTDSEKIQRQVDFLDQHPDYAMCFHSVKVFFENNEEPEYVYPDSAEGRTFTVSGLLKRNFIQTNSVMYRRQNYDEMPEGILPLDWYLHLFHAQFGKIGFIGRVMSAYRRHPGGIWWDSYNNLNEIWKKHGVAHFGLYVAILELYGKKPEHQKIIFSLISKLLSTLHGVDKKYNTALAANVMQKFPDTMRAFTLHQQTELDRQGALLDENEHEIQHLRSLVAGKEAMLQQREHELRLIKSSRFWRLRNKLASLTGRDVV